MTRIVLKKGGNIARQELEKALSALSFANVEAQGKIVAVYAVVKVDDSAVEKALAELTRTAV